TEHLGAQFHADVIVRRTIVFALLDDGHRLVQLAVVNIQPASQHHFVAEYRPRWRGNDRALGAERIHHADIIRKIGVAGLAANVRRNCNDGSEIAILDELHALLLEQRRIARVRVDHAVKAQARLAAGASHARSPAWRAATSLP